MLNIDAVGILYTSGSIIIKAAENLVSFEKKFIKYIAF